MLFALLIPILLNRAASLPPHVSDNDAVGDLKQGDPGGRKATADTG
jgi:hypothetical protein